MFSEMCSSVYRPDAALINYYKVGDTLGGHLDDVEKDMSKPIVSFSLGCDAIFLLGGKPYFTTMSCFHCICLINCSLMPSRFSSPLAYEHKSIVYPLISHALLYSGMSESRSIAAMS